MPSRGLDFDESIAHDAAQGGDDGLGGSVCVAPELVRADGLGVDSSTGSGPVCTDGPGVDGRLAFELSHDDSLGVGSGIAPKLVYTDGSGVHGRLTSELSRDSGLGADNKSPPQPFAASGFGFDIAGGRSGGAPEFAASSFEFGASEQGSPSLAPHMNSASVDCFEN